jgi:hypothetical protein
MGRYNISNDCNWGIFLYAHKNKFSPCISLFSLTLSFLPIYFAKSFRIHRKALHKYLSQGEKIFLEGNKLRQWPIFVAFIVIIQILLLLDILQVIGLKLCYLIWGLIVIAATIIIAF